MLNLRPYQQTVVDQTLRGFEQFNRQLAVVPTGGGKTIIFSHLAAAVQPRKTLILAHREELIDQAITKLAAATGIYAQKEKAEAKASLGAQVVVASIQTLTRRLGKWPANHFGLVVVDEAHHALADSYQRILNHFGPSAWVLGVTATPDRGDKRNLGVYFENVSAEISLFDLIHQGFLAPISVQSIPLQIDLGGVQSVAGDYQVDQLGDALTPYLRHIAEAIRDNAGYRRTLAFLPLCATSRAFVEACNDCGLSACHVDGESQDRREILADFAAGKYDVLSNAMLLTEGYDDPGIECVVMLRPTRSRALYSQMVGRGTRIKPGKRNLLLLDFLWMHEQHNLIRPAHLIASSEEVAKEITEAIAKPSGEHQGTFDLEGIASETQAKREAKLAEELAAKAKRKGRTVDAMEFCLSLHATEAAEWEDTMVWHRKPITEGQRGILERNGIDVDTIKSRGHATAVIDLIISRSNLDLATPKQIWLMRQFGHKSPETIKFSEASAFLDSRIGKKKQQSTAQ